LLESATLARTMPGCDSSMRKALALALVVLQGGCSGTSGAGSGAAEAPGPEDASPQGGDPDPTGGHHHHHHQGPTSSTESSADAGPLAIIPITFTVEDQGAYCAQGDTCIGPGRIQIHDAAGSLLRVSSPECWRDCTDCARQTCPARDCLPAAFMVNTESLAWDGTHYETGTCQDGSACFEPLRAREGGYTATFCVSRGELRVSPTTAQAECVASSEPECVSIDFRLPAFEPVHAVLPAARSTNE
jgi:hypothetical protein